MISSLERHVDTAYLAISALETTFICLDEQFPRVVPWNRRVAEFVRENQYSSRYRITRGVLFILEMIRLTYYLKKCNAREARVALAISVLSGFSISTLVFATKKFMQRKISLSDHPKITVIHSNEDKVSESILIIRFACEIATYAISKSAYSLFGIALKSAAILSIARHTWVHFSVSHRFDQKCVNDPQADLTQIKIDLLMRAYIIKKGECGICFDDVDSSPDNVGILLCPRHTFHLSCITRWFDKGSGETKSPVEQIIKALVENTLSYTCDREFKKYIYEIDLKTSLLPKCPTCTLVPIYTMQGSVTATHPPETRFLKINLVN